MKLPLMLLVPKYLGQFFELHCPLTFPKVSSFLILFRMKHIFSLILLAITKRKTIIQVKSKNGKIVTITVKSYYTGLPSPLRHEKIVPLTSSKNLKSRIVPPCEEFCWEKTPFLKGQKHFFIFLVWNPPASLWSFCTPPQSEPVLRYSTDSSTITTYLPTSKANSMTS